MQAIQTQWSSRHLFGLNGEMDMQQQHKQTHTRKLYVVINESNHH